MRGEKQIFGATLVITMLGGNTYSAPAPEIAAIPAVAEYAEAPPAQPSFNFLGKVVTVEVLKTAPAPSSTTIVPAPERQHFEAPPASVPTPETWVPAAGSSFEQAAQDSINQVDFGSVGLSVAGIVPPEKQKRRPGIASESSTPVTKYLYLLLTRGDGCATAFVINESKVDADGHFIVHPVFAGQLPDLTDPDFINSREMFDGNKIIQAEAAENWTATLAELDLPSLLNSTQQLCDSYLNNQQVLASSTSSSSS